MLLGLVGDYSTELLRIQEKSRHDRGSAKSACRIGPHADVYKFIGPDSILILVRSLSLDWVCNAI